MARASTSIRSKATIPALQRIPPCCWWTITATCSISWNASWPMPVGSCSPPNPPPKPARLVNGSSAVLKVPMPHMEAEHELEGLRFWNGDPTVRVLFADDRTGAMLLERCEPGTPLRELPESDQDVVITGILRRLWRSPSAPHPFRRRAAEHFPTGPPLVIGRRRRDGAARIAGRLSREIGRA